MTQIVEGVDLDVVVTQPSVQNVVISQPGTPTSVVVSVPNSDLGVTGTAGPAVTVDAAAGPAVTVDAGVGLRGPQGDPGPPGPAGGGGFEYSQIIPSDTWTIAHGLGRQIAAVRIEDTAGRVFAEPDFTTTDLNTIVLHLAFAMGGKAVLI